MEESAFQRAGLVGGWIQCSGDVSLVWPRRELGRKGACGCVTAASVSYRWGGWCVWRPYQCAPVADELPLLPWMGLCASMLGLWVDFHMLCMRARCCSERG